MTSLAVLVVGFALGQGVPPPTPPVPQSPPATAAPPIPQSPPAAAPPAADSQSADARALARHRRDEIGVMEGVLTAAVRLGASQIAREMQSVMPGPGGPSGLLGTPKARGFILEGYGVFFNVEIPTLQTSLVWSMQQLQRDQEMTGQSLDALRSLVETLPDSDARRQYQAALKRLEQQVGPIPPRTTTPGAAAQVPVAEPDDFDARYTKAVISSCLDAMLEHSKPMNLGPDEWLTVALSSSDPTLAPPQLYESTTVVLRVKGSDLTEYLAGRLTKEQVRGRVEVREF